MTLLLFLDQEALVPTFTHGSKARLLWGAYDVSPFFRQASVDIGNDPVDTTAFQSTAHEYIPGLPDATLSAEGMFESTEDTGGDYALTAALEADKSAVSLYAEGDAVGKRGFSCHGVQTSYHISSPVDDVVQVTAEGQSCTAAEYVTSLTPLAQVTETGDGTTVDNGVSSTTGLAGYLHVTDVTAGDVAVTIQHSDDDVTFVDVVTFTTADGPTDERKTATGTIERYLRYSVTVTTGPATFQVGATRTPLA